MQPDMMRQLQELQDQAAQLGALARGLSQSRPERAEGADRTGRVTVVLDRFGLPASIEVRSGWEERLEPLQLGAAISEAREDAVSAGMRAWSTSLEDSRWYSQRHSYNNGEGGTASAEQPQPSAGERRDVAELAEAVLSEIEAAEQPSAPEPATVDGTDDGGQVTVRLDAKGSLSCLIDRHWASGRSGDAITSALRTALAAARAKLPSRNGPAGGVDLLLGDVLVTLESLTDL